MDLTSVAHHRAAFFRLTGSVAEDGALTMRGESTNDVVDLFLTRGCRQAQRWMLKSGYGGWRKRSTALTWSGTDAADGGRKATLPTDFLRAYGSDRPGRSALVEPDGRRWGQQVQPDDDERQGSGYYVRGDELWLLRGATVPATLYLDYHFRHPVWSGDLDDADIDFPLEARHLIVAEAADAARSDNWLPGGQEMEMKIAGALRRARDDARDIARPTKAPRRFKKATRFGNRW